MEEKGMKKVLKDGVDGFYAAIKDLQALTSQLRSKEMSCYMVENHQCVQKHDRFRMKLAALNRQREMELENCLETCKKQIPKSLAGREMLGVELKTKEEVEGFREFAKCHVECLGKGVSRVEEVKGEVKATLAEVSAYLP